VLVAFADGDPSRPIVIGSLHNAEAMPPQTLADHAARTTIRSRSLDDGGGYSEIVLDDTAGAERLSIRAERDLSVLVQRDDELDVRGGRTLKVADDAAIEIGGARSARIGGRDLVEAGEIELVATRSITLRCGGSVVRVTPSEIVIDAPMVKLNS
jgi:type VI secretion system secreted protein VgrG